MTDLDIETAAPITTKAEARAVWRDLPDDVKRKVKAGAQVLNRRFRSRLRPWTWRISLKRLDLGDCAQCVLGQLYGGRVGAYNHGLDIIAPKWAATWWARRHGFNVDDGLSYATLTRAWEAYLVLHRPGRVRREALV